MVYLVFLAFPKLKLNDEGSFHILFKNVIVC